MTLQEFYQKIDGNYNACLNRLLKEERIVKYLRLFPKSQNFDEFEQYMQTRQWQSAFRFVHTLKGNALNLELGCLIKSSVHVCEILRVGEPPVSLYKEIKDMKNDYYFVCEQIEELMKSYE